MEVAEIGIIMLKYLISDFRSALRFFPIGIGTGVVLFLLFTLSNRSLERKGKEKIKAFQVSAFYAYFVVILMITLLSREVGRGRALDLQLFSTLKINLRNDAYIVENILLFVPYGFFTMMLDRINQNVSLKLVRTVIWGGITSACIELIQLISHRGCCQLDDIWTNTVGAFVGAALYALVRQVARKIRIRRLDRISV